MNLGTNRRRNSRPTRNAKRAAARSTQKAHGDRAVGSWLGRSRLIGRCIRLTRHRGRRRHARRDNDGRLAGRRAVRLPRLAPSAPAAASALENHADQAQARDGNSNSTHGCTLPFRCSGLLLLKNIDAVPSPSKNIHAKTGRGGQSADLSVSGKLFGLRAISATPCPADLV